MSSGSADTANPLAGLIQAGLQAYASQMGAPAPRKSSGGSARAEKTRSKKGKGRKRQPSSSSSGRSPSSSSVSGSEGGQFTENFSRIELKSYQKKVKDLKIAQLLHILAQFKHIGFTPPELQKLGAQESLFMRRARGRASNRHSLKRQGLLSQLNQKSSGTYKARLQSLLCCVLNVDLRMQFRQTGDTLLKQHVREFERQWKHRLEKEGHMVASAVRSTFKKMARESEEDSARHNQRCACVSVCASLHVCR